MQGARVGKPEGQGRTTPCRPQTSDAMNRLSPNDEQVFADAIARPARERMAFLDDASNGDTALRDRIVALFKAHNGTNSLLSSAQIQPITLHEERPGDHIGLSAVSPAKAGRYKLLQKMGECGWVWCGWPSMRSRCAAASR